MIGVLNSARRTGASWNKGDQLVKISKYLRSSGFLVVFTAILSFGNSTLIGAEVDEAEAGAEVALEVKTEGLLGPDDFQDLLTNSPFTRTLNLSDVLSLTGVANIEGKPVLTLLNRTTREAYLVSEEPNDQGWRIVEIYPSHELGKVEAKISAGAGQIVSVRFDEKQLKPEENRPSRPAGRDQGGDQRRQWGGNRDGGERRGPDPEMMRKYQALSPEQQQRYREIMREQFMRNRNMSAEERQRVSERALEAASGGGDRGRGRGR